MTVSNRNKMNVALLLTLVPVILVTIPVGGMMISSRNGSQNVAAGQAAEDSIAASTTVDQVPVLCYHYLRGKTDPVRIVRVFGYVVLALPLLHDTEIWTTSLGSFERQMEYMTRRGYHTVTLDELNEWQLGRRTLPPKPVVITFDDADRSVYDYAFPILKRYGMKATVFVVTAHVGTRWRGVDVLGWAELREMHDSGVFAIESHTHDMHYKVNERSDATPVFLASFDQAQPTTDAANWRDMVRTDLISSHDAIRKNIGHAPRYLAWPYGFGSGRANRVAAEAGFMRTCSLHLAPNVRIGSKAPTPDAGSFEIPRYTVTARTSLRSFREMLECRYVPGM